MQTRQMYFSYKNATEILNFINLHVLWLWDFWFNKQLQRQQTAEGGKGITWFLVVLTYFNICFFLILNNFKWFWGPFACLLTPYWEPQLYRNTTKDIKANNCQLSDFYSLCTPSMLKWLLIVLYSLNFV